MNNNDKIIELIKSGAEVHSLAMGRVGVVTGWVEGTDKLRPVITVRPFFRKTESVTTFDFGDKVTIEQNPKDGVWEIRNVWTEKVSEEDE